jgi:hypothetical protein
MSGDLRSALQAIYDQHGRITPALVVDGWRSPDHPDHARLPWDDREAAEAHRRHVAADLIRSVRMGYVTPTGGESTIRYWQAERTERGYAYQPADKIVQDPMSREILLRDMEREWRQLRERYDRFVEFAKMVDDYRAAQTDAADTAG